jgi:hypothetical protein
MFTERHRLRGYGWSPYLSVEDAKKPDDVREALREKAHLREQRILLVYIGLHLYQYNQKK